MPTPQPPRRVDAAELFMLTGDGYRCELVAEELQMVSLAGVRHGRIANRIANLLSIHVSAHWLGVVYAAETGFLIATEPDTVLAPDVAYIGHSKHEQIEDESGMCPSLQTGWWKCSRQVTGFRVSKVKLFAGYNPVPN